MKKEIDEVKLCKWVYDGMYDAWETGCGKTFSFSNSESLRANGFKFCYSCGKKVKGVKRP